MLVELQNIKVVRMLQIAESAFLCVDLLTI